MRTTAAALVSSLRPFAPKADFILLDEAYSAFDEDYFVDEFIPFWKDWINKAALEWKVDVSDCDDFALHFRSQAILSIRKLNPLAGLLVAEMEIVINGGVTSLGISGFCYHERNLVGVGNPVRWMVVEPQTGEWQWLRDNEDLIMQIRV